MRHQVETRRPRATTAAVGVSTVVLSLVAAACASSTAEFETVDGEEGRLGAHYEIDVRDTNFGDVRVWSRGAYPLETNGEKPVVQFNLRIRNDSDQPLRLALERTELELATDERRLYLVEEVARLNGPTEIPPLSTARLALYFRLPKDLKPGDISNLELSWVVMTPAGPFSESTPFKREHRRAGAQTQVVFSAWHPWYPWYRYRWAPVHPFWW